MVFLFFIQKSNLVSNLKESHYSHLKYNNVSVSDTVLHFICGLVKFCVETVTTSWCSLVLATISTAKLLCF